MSRSDMPIQDMMNLPRYRCNQTLRMEESIASLRQFFPEATAMLTDLMEARPMIRTELIVKTLDGGQLISGLVDCAATLDFVSEDFVRRFSLTTRKSQTKTLVRFANGQCVTSSTICDLRQSVTHLRQSCLRDSSPRVSTDFLRLT
jgi:hypothetical protein